MNARRLSVVGGQPETPLPQWDCEHQLVGALLHLPATAAAPILELVPDTAIWPPANRWAYELIGHLVADGCDPDPVLVLATARHRPPNDHRGPVSTRRHHDFAVHLANLYTRAINPALVGQYAREVLDDAYRRAIGLHGARMQQLCESGASREDLTDYLTAMRTDLADLWRRGQAARPPERAS
jgi:replicative DNA helicase